jgi:hypothetical protein
VFSWQRKGDKIKTSHKASRSFLKAFKKKIAPKAAQLSQGP